MATPTSIRPSLESGDRLTRAEFHRRYCARPDIKKAELVEGVVYLTSPVRREHGQQHGTIAGWLYAYAARHPDVFFEIETTVQLDSDNEVQPAALLWRDEPGGPSVSADGHLEGAPQLVLEIAVSSASYDLHDKLRAYRRAGVREYVVWRVLDRAIDWFRLREGEYERVDPDATGLIASAVFPGLRLNLAKMLSGDHPSVLADLDAGPPQPPASPAYVTRDCP